MLQRRELVLDGLRLSFLEQGSQTPGKSTLVLLHGLMGSSETFRPLLAELPAEQHVIALDFPGSGFSERRVRLDATLPAMAVYTLDVLEELGVVQPCVLGHSHGGAVALRMAQGHPERVGPLVLLAPAHPYFDEGDPVVRFYLSLPGRLFAYSIPWFPKWMQMIGLRRMAGPKNDDTLARLAPYRDNLRTPGTMRHILRLLKTWQQDMNELRELLRTPVEHPALMLWGDNDRAVPSTSAEELCKHFSFPDLRILPGVGHRPAEERPALVASMVSVWMQQMDRWGWRYSPKVEEIHARSASLMTPSFGSGD